MTADYQVFLMDGMKVNECVVPNEDGSYTIFINQNLCEEKRMDAYNHAMRHIDGNDFEKSDIQIIEFKMHNLRRKIK